MRTVVGLVHTRTVQHRTARRCQSRTLGHRDRPQRKSHVGGPSGSSGASEERVPSRVAQQTRFRFAG